MNLQVTELKIGNVAAAQINWNGAEIKSSLNVALEDYRNMVVTEETLKGSKDIMSELNKQAKSIDDFRKSTVKQLNPDIKKFESEAKELVSMIKEARTVIADQVEIFINKQREEKRELVNHRIDALNQEYELEEEFTKLIEFKDQYLNSSLSLNKVEQDLRLQYDQAKQLQEMKHQKIDTVKIIVDTYNDQLEFKFDCKEFNYLLEADIKTISETVKAKVIGRIEQEKETRERLKREQEEAVEAAKLKAKQEAEAEALRVKEETKQTAINAEKAHQEELRQSEIRKQSELRKLEQEKNKVIEVISNTIEEVEQFIPDDTFDNTTELKDITLHILSEQHKIDALKNYLAQYEIEYVLEVK